MRVFIACDISNPQTVSALAAIKKKLLENVRGKAAEGYHFTLQFLGEVSDENVSLLTNALDTISFAPFPIILADLGAFPSLNKIHIIWAGTDEQGADQLRALAQEVRERTAPLRFFADKPFVPHLTLIRVKHAERSTIEPYLIHTFGHDTIDSIVLKKSELTPEGAKYTTIHRVSAKV